LAVVVRPSVLRYSGAQWRATLLLCTTTAAMTLCFFAAIQRLPLGLAIATDFLGPLSVAVFGSGIRWRLTWQLIVAAGILFLA
ncbi:EamA family transporter, partial [Rhizobium ruizarguesonis]